MKPVVVDQSGWGLLRVTGKDRVRFLQGMLTNDVALVPVGGFVRAVLLSVKGRVLAVVEVLNESDAFLLLTEPVTAEIVRTVLGRHAVMDDVAFAPVAAAVHRIWGTPAEVWTAPLLFDTMKPSAPEEVEARRIEGGLPRYGVDVSEDHFAVEANLDSCISTTKGCYLGQEVTTRLHARGHVNRRLVGIRLGKGGVVAAGSPIGSVARPDAGQITSSIVSPDFGPIALGYVHRSSWEPGTVVTVGEHEGVVVRLPFSA